MRFRIRYGLGGGFGGAGEWEEIDAPSQEAAETEARVAAIEIYDSYAGMHGLRDEEQIMANEDCSEEEAAEIYQEEMDSWLEYEAEPI